MRTIEKTSFDETIEDQHYDPVSLIIAFLAVERSQEAEILEIDLFSHWEESFEAFKFFRYNRPRFVCTIELMTALPACMMNDQDWSYSSAAGQTHET